MFQSPKKYILTRARSLPVHQCYITEGWQESGNATIVVARRHTNGHFTIGTYLVDLYCLGVKDTAYNFNVDKEQLDEILETSQSFGVAMIPCDYAEAHNIIYGAIEFAEEYGFKPHKDFAVTKYILEEDDESVELIEYESGMDGKPCVFVDAEHPQKAVIAQLEKTAGIGNFTVINVDELEDDEFDEFDEEDDMDDEYDLENWTEQDWQDCADGKIQVSDEDFPLLIDAMYSRLAEQGHAPNSKTLAEEFLDEFTLTGEFAELDYEVSEEENCDMVETTLSMDNAEMDDITRFFPVLKQFILKYPKNIVFYDLLVNSYFQTNNLPAALETSRGMMLRFPDSYLAKLYCCVHHIRSERFDKILAVLAHAIDLEHLPAMRNFIVVEMLLYCAVLCRYHLHQGDLRLADVYHQASKIVHRKYHIEPSNDFIGETFLLIAIRKAEYLRNMKPESSAM